ncbi:Chromate resistance protein ChrB [Actinocrispum sp. NPDC049592]|uniref:Chromate resistance protein ChrB n=1 Tax=Actinocrispum sp. NPDC049592 TaxID=3154835 RepID=UPI003412A47D
MADVGRWVLLSYRLPREPSTPRITVWRKLKRLGVALISDGLVALPADARTREQLEWIADEVVEAGGNAAIWIAEPGAVATERDLAKAMAKSRANEYTKVTAEALEGSGLGDLARMSLARRLRAELRRIYRRDYFPPNERDQAMAAVEALVAPAMSQREQPS